jgi:eukaryotic-like serine/threonine-protein kinase
MKVRAISGRTASTLEVQGVVDGPIPWPAPYGTPATRGALVVVDLGAVPYVTVEGIAAWPRSLKVLGDEVYLSRVRPAVLALLGMNAGLMEGLVVVTFYCPYVCSSCKAPFERLADLRVDGPAIEAGAPPFHQCPTCGGVGAFDDNPKTLFSPVVHQGELRLPEGIDALVEGKPDVVASAQLDIELDVEGDVTALWLAGTLQRSRPLIRVAPGLRGPLVIVASEIAGTTGEGLDSLRELLMNIDGEVVLARVSSQLAQGLATTLHGTGKAAVVSGRLPYHCDKCNKVQLIDVELTTLAKGSIQNCPACGAIVKARFGDREVLPLASLPTAPLGEEVRSYLARHAHPPSVDRSAEWTSALALGSGSSLADPTTSLPLPTVPSENAVLARSSDAGLSRRPARPPHSVTNPVMPSASASAALSSSQTDDHASTALDRVAPTRPSSSASSAAADPAGGRYEIIRRLGQGGMAETLLGRHVGLGGFEKRVVIKRILPNLASQPAFVDMFLHEARVAARINHSNVVQIFDFGRMGEDYYIVMEYVRGWDLSSLIRSSVRLGRPIPIEVACRIAAEVCAGLTAAHNAMDDTGTPNPIIHRDISPHNILLSLDGAVKLSDFGIAKTARDVEKMAATDPGSVKGKVAYLAPEVIQGTAPTTKIDIYAVGLTLYTALVGRNPYQRKGDIQTMYAVAQEPLPNIIKERRDVPFQLASIVGRAVHRDAGQRFPTAQMLQLHLESFLSEIERQQPSTPMHIALWDHGARARRAGAPRRPADGQRLHAVRYARGGGHPRHAGLLVVGAAAGADGAGRGVERGRPRRRAPRCGRPVARRNADSGAREALTPLSAASKCRGLAPRLPPGFPLRRGPSEVIHAVAVVGPVGVRRCCAVRVVTRVRE